MSHCVDVLLISG